MRKLCDAICSGLNSRCSVSLYIPPALRKSGIPDSVDMPAPPKKTARWLALRMVRSFSMESIIVLLSISSIHRWGLFFCIFADAHRGEEARKEIDRIRIISVAVKLNEPCSR